MSGIRFNKHHDIRKLLYAPNIHQGGGKTLLLPLLKQLEGKAVFVLDERLELPKELSNIQVIWVKPNLIARLYTEFKLWWLVPENTTVLCMGNLPPLLAKGKLKVFVQNRYLVEKKSLTAFKASIQLRIGFERLWLAIKASSVETFIVQTPSMQQLLFGTLKRQAKILPFIPRGLQSQLRSGQPSTILYDFLYIASGEPHKNHEVLIEAWIYLAQQKRFPSLCLTLEYSQCPELHDWVMTKVKEFGLRITLIGELPNDQIGHLYNQARALVYPSEYESFGLPLIEAVICGLPVLACDKPYVTDVIKPSVVFSSRSYKDLAQAIANFSFEQASMNIKLLDEEQFLAVTLEAEDKID